VTLENANRRTAHIKRFLAKPPRGSSRLRVTTEGDAGTVVLATWDRAAAVPELALELDALVADHAEETQRYVTARIDWVDRDDLTLSSKILRGRPDQEDPLNGSDQAQSAQAQRHLEAMTRLYVSGHSATVTKLTDLVETLSGVAQKALCDAQRANEDAASARAEAAEAIRHAEDSSTDTRGDRVMQLAEMAVQHGLMTGAVKSTPSD